MELVSPDILREILNYFTKRQLSYLRRVSKQWKLIIENIKEIKPFIENFQKYILVGILISNVKNTFYEIKDLKLNVNPKQYCLEANFPIKTQSFKYNHISSVSFHDNLFYFEPREFKNEIFITTNIDQTISMLSKDIIEQLTSSFEYEYLTNKFLIIIQNNNPLRLRIISIDTKRVMIPKNCTISKIMKFKTDQKLFILLPKLKISGWYDFDTNQFHISKEYMVYCKEKDLYISLSHIYDFKKRTKKAIEFHKNELQETTLQSLKVVDFIVIFKFSYHWHSYSRECNTFGFLNLLNRNSNIVFIKFSSEMKLMDLNSFTSLVLFMESKQKLNPTISVYHIKTGDLVRNINLTTNEEIQYCKFNHKGILIVGKTTFIQLFI